MEDLWPANDLPREGFDDGIYTNEVMTDLDDGKLVGVVYILDIYVYPAG